MTTPQPFNIFKVLEKDDKELIHSSFLRFLLTENDTIYRRFLKIAHIEFSKPILEKTYNIPNGNKEGKKKDRKRIDIEVTSLDKEHILVIENKFKSFPYEQQLSSYNNLYNIQHKDKQKHKFLLCFDKSLVSFTTDWVVFDYNDLLSFIKENYFDNKDTVKSLFIKQYHEFLSAYYEKYKLLTSNSKSLFQKPYDNENKFWLRLIYSALHLELIKYFKTKNISVRFDLNPGSTSVPLLNIIPENWKVNGKELLIQFQGDDLKFYSHSNDKTFIENIVLKAKDEFQKGEVEFKKMTKREANTYFVFKTKLTTKMNDNNNFNLTSIMNAVISYYNDIDEKVIKQLQLTTHLQ